VIVHFRQLLAVSVVGIALAALVPATTGATVPPRNCGPLTVANRHYIIKADQLRCTTAKTSAKNYLVSHRRPRGFTCKNFKNTAMTFRCSKGIKVFFAIRR
jgi:hypothetical protein